MLENNKSSLEYDEENISELVGSDDIRFLEGKLKTCIDSLGLPEKQEKATKDITQEIIWDWFYYIKEHYTDYLQEKRKWYFKSKLKENA